MLCVFCVFLFVVVQFYPLFKFNFVSISSSFISLPKHNGNHWNQELLSHNIYGMSIRLLVSLFVNSKNLSGCEEIPGDVIENIKKKTDIDTPLCRVKSGVDGLFVFPSVPSGEYTLVSIWHFFQEIDMSHPQRNRTCWDNRNEPNVKWTVIWATTLPQFMEQFSGLIIFSVM